ncbi:MAG: hypothetical protein EGQ35_07690, partial [Clostridiales bacterium]|nr:hypothetical protein [Clostridiales bacterium]
LSPNRKDYEIIKHLRIDVSAFLCLFDRAGIKKYTDTVNKTDTEGIRMNEDELNQNHEQEQSGSKVVNK